MAERGKARKARKWGQDEKRDKEYEYKRGKSRREKTAQKARGR